MSRLDDMLARQPVRDGQVYVAGGWVDYCATVPTAAGVGAVIAFALKCWHDNVSLNLALAQAEQQLKGDKATIASQARARTLDEEMADWELHALRNELNATHLRLQIHVHDHPDAQPVLDALYASKDQLDADQIVAMRDPAKRKARRR